MTRQRFPRRFLMPVLTITASVSLVLVSAACGSAASDQVAHVNSTANASATTTQTSGTDAVPAAIKFTNCMRAHGVPMLDPGPGGNILYNAPSTPQAVIRQAQQACNHFLPKVTMSPQQHAAVVDRMVKFVHCMLAHNQPVKLLNNGGGVGYAVPQNSGVNVNSQAFKTTEANCTKKYLKAAG